MFCLFRTGSVNTLLSSFLLVNDFDASRNIRTISKIFCCFVVFLIFIRIIIHFNFTCLHQFVMKILRERSWNKDVVLQVISAYKNIHVLVRILFPKTKNISITFRMLCILSIINANAFLLFPMRPVTNSPEMIKKHRDKHFSNLARFYISPSEPQINFMPPKTTKKRSNFCCCQGLWNGNIG